LNKELVVRYLACFDLFVVAKLSPRGIIDRTVSSNIIYKELNNRVRIEYLLNG